MTKKEFYNRFALIQQKLKVPKDNRNSFGNYNYRTAEDIFNALKEHLDAKDGESVFCTTEVKQIGERYYIEAIAIFTNGEFSIEAKASAREEENKKGMDASQITGAATSYARKYALSGLFGIDNEKDADSEEIPTIRKSIQVQDSTHKTLKAKLEAGEFEIIRDSGAYPKVEISGKKFQIYPSKSGYGHSFATDRYFVNFKDVSEEGIKQATLKEKNS